jgi:hypothetical protein
MAIRTPLYLIRSLNGNMTRGRRITGAHPLSSCWTTPGVRGFRRLCLQAAFDHALATTADRGAPPTNAICPVAWRNELLDRNLGTFPASETMRHDGGSGKGASAKLLPLASQVLIAHVLLIYTRSSSLAYWPWHRLRSCTLCRAWLGCRVTIAKIVLRGCNVPRMGWGRHDRLRPTL